MLSAERQVELVRLVKQGGTAGDEALEALINGIRPMVERLAWNFANAHPGSMHGPEDFVQEAISVLPRVVERYDDNNERGASLSTYARKPILCTMINLTRTPDVLNNAVSLDVERRAGGDGKGRVWIEDIVDHRLPPEEALEKSCLLEDLGKALTSLPEVIRQVVELHYELGPYQRHNFNELGLMIDRTDEGARQLNKEGLRILGQQLEDWF